MMFISDKAVLIRLTNGKNVAILSNGVVIDIFNEELKEIFLNSLIFNSESGLCASSSSYKHP